MIQRLLTVEYLFWLVLFSFYVVDNIKLVRKDHVAIAEKLSGGYAPLIALSQYELAGMEIKLLNLFLPFRMAFLLECDPRRPASRQAQVRTERLLKRMRYHLLGLRVIATLACLVLLAGPVLTYYFGLLFALLLLLPLHLGLLFSAIVLLVASRKQLRLPAGKLALLIAESILVPAYLGNIVRRISWKWQLPADGYQFSLRRAAPSELEWTRYRIGKKLEQLIEQYEPGQPGHRLYSDYKTGLGV